MSTIRTNSSHKEEILKGDRYPFGRNWAKFLSLLNEDRINLAVESLKHMLSVNNLNEKTFLDIGSGSGLFSLAARKLGANVVSFDYDPQSVACTSELKRRFYENDQHWQIETGSVLDSEYIRSLGQFDYVYSWGVLHHTGKMWDALNNASIPVNMDGKLFVAIYNYQPIVSTYWLYVKKIYNKYPITKPFFVFLHFLYPVLPSILIKFLLRRSDVRGMNAWYNLLDWLGGYPFEVARPEEVFDFYKNKSFVLEKMTTVSGRMGCNEFVFKKS